LALVFLGISRDGIRVDASFSAEGANQKTDMNLMDFNLSQQKRKAFSRDAQVYDLIEPVLQIAPNGSVDYV
jgi:hypothetical protein